MMESRDILLAGNKFDVEVETTPADASPGVFMKEPAILTSNLCGLIESGLFLPYNVKDVKAIRVNDAWSLWWE